MSEHLPPQYHEIEPLIKKLRMFENLQAVPERLGLRRVPGGFIAVSLICGDRFNPKTQRIERVIVHFTSAFVPYDEFMTEEEHQAQQEWDALSFEDRIEVMLFEAWTRLDNKLEEIFKKYQLEDFLRIDDGHCTFHKWWESDLADIHSKQFKVGWPDYIKSYPG